MIHTAMSEAAAANPEHCAVWGTEGTLTYAELDKQSSSLASWVNHKLPGTGHHIALLMPKCLNAVIAIFGILKSGNTYAPLGENWTHSRLQKIFDSSKFALCITHLSAEDSSEFAQFTDLSFLQADSEDWIQALATADIPNNRSDDTPGSCTANKAKEGAHDKVKEDAHDNVTYLAKTFKPADLAYILYTSGSTGVPKGVCVSHRAASHFPMWAIAEYGLCEQDRIASVSPLTFDLTTFDLFATLGAGATLYLVPENLKIFPARLSKFLVEHNITRMYAVPSTLILLAQRGKLKERDFSQLKSVIFAGEEFPVPQFRQLTNLLPDHIGYSNLYGPTETNVCTYFHVPREFNESSMPLGHALPGMHLFVRRNADTTSEPDRHMEGELCVSGPSVMSGYLGQKHLDSSVWVETIQGSEPQAYATGDQTSLSADGLWNYHGRIDKMVKIWGYRVELGEIENCLLSHNQVEQAVVVKRPPGSSAGDELMGFVVRNDKICNSVNNLQENDSFVAKMLTHCKAHLPQYMVPKTIKTVPDLPMNNSGKIDRLQLEQIAANAS